MQVEVIPQIELGSVHRLRIGDFLNKTIADEQDRDFRFAVAYMRLSGLDRLGAALDTLLNRGGHVAGAIGLDDEITSIEALESLSQISSDSTLFYTVSDFIYHPKLYLMSGEKRATAIVGSANLTRDGLFRNVEFATAVHLDLEVIQDREIFKQYDKFMNELLDTTHPNVQPVDEHILRTLAQANVIKSEAQMKEPGSPVRSNRRTKVPGHVETLFPSIRVPVAPPGRKLRPGKSLAQPVITVPPRPIGIAGTFVMTLSPFDSSHRSGVKGTADVLIPLRAISFFPALQTSGRKYQDAYFNVVLNTNTGRERHNYRLWYYPAKGEHRLTMDKETIDLSNASGGDLLVISKLNTSAEDNILFEVTILSQTDPNYPAFLALCTNEETQGKKWGLTDI